ncbi:hypothetical protein Tco_0371237 [Tanacetum coccineum]
MLAFFGSARLNSSNIDSDIKLTLAPMYAIAFVLNMSTEQGILRLPGFGFSGDCDARKYSAMVISSTLIPTLGEWFCVEFFEGFRCAVMDRYYLIFWGCPWWLLFVVIGCGFREKEDGFCCRASWVIINDGTGMKTMSLLLYGLAISVKSDAASVGFDVGGMFMASNQPVGSKRGYYPRCLNADDVMNNHQKGTAYGMSRANKDKQNGFNVAACADNVVGGVAGKEFELKPSIHMLLFWELTSLLV